MGSSFRVVHEGMRGGRVELDGQDISNAVRGLYVDMRAGHVPQVTLDLVVIDVTELGAERAQVLIDPSTRELLRAAGWMPPARGYVINGVVYAPEDVQVMTDAEEPSR